MSKFANQILFNKAGQVRPVWNAAKYVALNRKDELRTGWKVLGLTPIAVGITVAVSTKTMGQTVVADNIGKMVSDQGIKAGDTILFKNSAGGWSSASVNQIKNVGDDFDPKTEIVGFSGSPVPKNTQAVWKFKRGEPIVITTKGGKAISGNYFGIKQYSILYYTEGEARVSIPLSEVKDISPAGAAEKK